MNPLSSVNIFFAFSSADKEIRERLEKHLTILKKNNIINIWHEEMIRPGEEREQKISEQLKNSDLILALISVDFLDSDNSYDTEIEKSLGKNKKIIAKVIPIIVSSCNWQDTNFSRTQVLPKNGQPIIGSHNIPVDQILADVVAELKREINIIRQWKNIDIPVLKKSTISKDELIAKIKKEKRELLHYINEKNADIQYLQTECHKLDQENTLLKRKLFTVSGHKKELAKRYDNLNNKLTEKLADREAFYKFQNKQNEGNLKNVNKSRISYKVSTILMAVIIISLICYIIFK